MEYPLISEYREAILSAEDNFNELSSLRPVLDDYGNPVMSSGNFAVVFKMRDENDGKLYAVKCFIKDQEGRDESYRKIADELEMVSSSYVLPLRYLENELFVDNYHCSEEEFPVVVMEWIEGETLDAYLNRNLHDTFELEMLSYRFNRMAAWLLAQPFAHGDLKPDNILVRKDGSLVLVDYDGMFVPAMKGEKAREIGSPDYRHPSHTYADFDEHIDDFSIAVIALSLKAIALNPSLKSSTTSSDGLLLGSSDFQDSANSAMLKKFISSSSDSELSLHLSAFFLALAKNSLDMLSFRVFMTERPKLYSININNHPNIISTTITKEEMYDGIMDKFGAIYSKDGKKLLAITNEDLTEYTIKDGTKVICDEAFRSLSNLKYVQIPSSIICIGNYAFANCSNLQDLTIPSNVSYIGKNPFWDCHRLTLILESNSNFNLVDALLIDSQGRLIACLNDSPHIVIPDSVSIVGEDAFSASYGMYDVILPNSIKRIEDNAFSGCEKLKNIDIPSSVKSIGNGAFRRCNSLLSIKMYPLLITKGKIGINPFEDCSKLQISLYKGKTELHDQLIISQDGVLIACLNKSTHITLPMTVRAIGENAFIGCKNLKEIEIPNTVSIISNNAFRFCTSLQNLIIPDSVLTIGENAFEGCSALKNVFLPKFLKSIESETFASCKSLTRIYLSNHIKGISNKAFSHCTALEEISLPDSITFIGSHAFEACESLQRISLSSNLVSIGTGAFLMCSEIESIHLPESLQSLGASAFHGCTFLKNVTLPSLLHDIEDFTFRRCRRLREIIIPNGVVSIGDGAFWECRGLQAITIPSSVESIGELAFWECHSLKKAFLPANIDKIRSCTFPSMCEIIYKDE